MLKCGLLGKKLGHSYSPAIHKRLGDYEYLLYEKTEEELEDFLLNGSWHGLNVTIPYKKAVVPFCSELSETAKKTGSVNTLVRRKDGTIYGDNTDVYGFEALVKKNNVAVEGKKVLVLGSGGASTAVCAALERLGAKPVVISRSGENNYENLERHSDAAVIVNTTPVGMYPDNLRSPLDLNAFKALAAVLDAVYNPALTGILLQAEKMGISQANGLYMLVAQAVRSSEKFTETTINDAIIDKITEELAAQMKNIVLIGMPGCGKSSIAEKLGEKLARPVADSDAEIVKQAGCDIPKIFAEQGEESFRKYETEVLTDLGKASGTILSTGGGCVTREENYERLHQNGTIFWIRRDEEKLAREGRPLSTGNLSAMYAVRKPLYERFADYVIENDGTVEEAAEKVISRLMAE